jgi:hypothetical protein
MGWKTVYITGRPGFYDDTVKNLERSGIEFMAGYLTRQSTDTYELFWVPEEMSIGEFKRAIGARTVLRYRLHFYLALEEFVDQVGSAELTAEDKQKIARMRLTNAA